MTKTSLFASDFHAQFSGPISDNAVYMAVRPEVLSAASPHHKAATTLIDAVAHCNSVRDHVVYWERHSVRLWFKTNLNYRPMPITFRYSQDGFVTVEWPTTHQPSSKKNAQRVIDALNWRATPWFQVGCKADAERMLETWPSILMERVLPKAGIKAAAYKPWADQT